MTEDNLNGCVLSVLEARAIRIELWRLGAQGLGQMTTPLHQSIAHWERLAACRTLSEIRAEGLRGGDCALCRVYCESELTLFARCAECPVRIRTARPECRGTPYYAAREYVDECEDDLNEFDPNEWQKLARAELDFLKGLEE